MLHYSEFSLQVGLLDQLQADELHQMEEEARKHWEEGNFQEYAKVGAMFYFKRCVDEARRHNIKEPLKQKWKKTQAVPEGLNPKS